MINMKSLHFAATGRKKNGILVQAKEMEERENIGGVQIYICV